MRVVVVEDQDDLREEIVIFLNRLGMDTEGASTSIELDRIIANRKPDLILLDIGLPGEDGISIAKRLKETPGLTVVMLTARSSLEDRALSLESGADNYLVKPVSLRELQAVIERVSQKLRTGVVGSPKSWYLLRYECVLRSPLGKNITLTASEFKLLECMIAHRGQPARQRMGPPLQPRSRCRASPARAGQREVLAASGPCRQRARRPQPVLQLYPGERVRGLMGHFFRE